MYLATRFTLLLAATRELRAEGRDVWRWFSWAWRFALWVLLLCLRACAFAFLWAYIGGTSDPALLRAVNDIFQQLGPEYWLAFLFITNNGFSTRVPRIEQEN